MKTMSTEELINLLDANEDLNIVDVREDNEVEEGMIPGAIHIPLGQIPERANELDSSKEYILVCRGGVRSEKACQYLESQGFQVVNLEGGMMAYDGELEFK
ncbi:rhodanese-like domain-containing protein [Lysinibacillus endophyticus]|uniref:Rhodanese-like domain-containing protein n=1 Tax=Ureibacillus endophyticus TaxID=1978490 RepID=A0A494Z675_9BACL|nr:rhodanese-like domain-containing protein [Lysinibacillus endophyticus]MCP1144161.1 rhodanese-like domain-containing protein [Lysinibacillus endophyticus]RKQ18051.1 rhodanese-like domain-containing protein [Lysinibacillus endophyticus]